MIQAVLELGETMKTNIIELVKSVGELVTLPAVFVHINQLIENQDSTIADISQAVSQDPAFTVRLLRVANSSFYGFPTSIDTVSKAVSILGTSQIRSLSLSTTIANSFSGLANKLVSIENFWRHSLYCGLLARKLARLAGHCDNEAVFTAGLLHDIGELVLFNRMPEEAYAALMQVLDSVDELQVYQAEQQILGFDHAQIGGELARQWKLPPLLEECIAYHHDIASASRFPREVAIVHIANILAVMAELRTQNLEDVSPIDPQAWRVTGLTAAEVIAELVSEVQAEIADAEKLFFPQS
jgi:putative nucleotidyltransferase with HDIG domain